MAMQMGNTAPGRNSFKSASMQTKIPTPAHKTTVTADTVKSGNGHTPGAAVKGFSGAGTLKAKLKV